MQVSPAPAPRDTTALLRQLRHSSAQQQPLQHQPRPPTTALNTAALLGQLAAGGTAGHQQQHDNQRQSASVQLLDAASLQQHHQPPAAVGPGIGRVASPALQSSELLRQVRPDAGQKQPQRQELQQQQRQTVDTAALLGRLAEGAQSLRQHRQQQQGQPAAPFDTAGLLSRLAEGAQPRQQQQHSSLSQPLDTAVLLQQLDTQQRAPYALPLPQELEGDAAPTQPAPTELLERLKAVSSDGHHFTPLRGTRAQPSPSAEPQGAAGAGAGAAARTACIARQGTAWQSAAASAPAGDGGPRELERGLAAAILEAEQREQQAEQAAARKAPGGASAQAALLSSAAQEARVGPLFGHDLQVAQQQPLGGAVSALAAPPSAAPSLAASDSPSVSETVMGTPSPPPVSSGNGATQPSWGQRQEQLQQQGQGRRLASPTQLVWGQEPASLGFPVHASAQPRLAPELQLPGGHDGGMGRPAGLPRQGGAFGHGSGQLPEPTVLVPEPQPAPAAGPTGCAEGPTGRLGPPAATPGPAQHSHHPQQQQQEWEQAVPGSASIQGGGGGESDAGSVARAGDAVSQVADSEHGVFEGMAAILDPDLPKEEAARCELWYFSSRPDAWVGR
jgi:hypothetical protein